MTNPLEIIESERAYVVYDPHTGAIVGVSSRIVPPKRGKIP